MASPLSRVGGGGRKMGSSVKGICFWPLSGKSFLRFFPSKRGVTAFLTPSTRRSQKCHFHFVLVFGPHVGLMQTVCPRNGLTEQPQPPKTGGGGGGA